MCRENPSAGNRESAYLVSLDSIVLGISELAYSDMVFV